MAQVNKTRRKRRTTRGKLIEGMTGSLPARLFANPFFKSALKAVLKASPGIYALYRDGALYYVGLSKDLNVRIKHHLEDRHRRKWDTFKIFKVRNVGYLKDLETLILQIVPPEGNRQIGRLPKKQRQRLTQPFKSALKHMKQEVDVIYKALGDEGVESGATFKTQATTDFSPEGAKEDRGAIAPDNP